MKLTNGDEIVVSSANIITSAEKFAGKSFTQVRNSSCPRIDPWGTPVVIAVLLDKTPLKVTTWLL